jgi:protein phosphatase
MKPNRSIDVPLWLTVSPVVGATDSPPPAAEVHVEFGAHTRSGADRLVNTDHYLVLNLGRHQETVMTSLPDYQIPPRFDEFGYGMVIADGKGSGGEVASRVAIATLVHLIVYFGKWNVRINEVIAEEVMNRAERFYRSIDATLSQAGQPDPIDMQTTLTAVVTAGNELIFAHVGDSRAYLFRNGALLRLTRDHPLETGTLGRPVVPVDATATGPELESALAGAPGPKIDVERVGMLDGDAVLLCTDGLTNALDDAAIAKVMKRHRRPDDQCKTLVDLGVAGGGTDDMTALVGHYRIAG